MHQGLILLAHGARDSRWREPFDDLARRIRAKRLDLDVRPAFLEMMSPDLLTAGAELVAARCEAILVVPVFLGQGGHVREDVPALVDSLRSRYPGIAVTQTGAAGEDEGVLDALAAFCLQGLDTLGDNARISRS